MKRTIYSIITEDNDGWICELLLCRDKAELEASIARLKVEEKGESLLELPIVKRKY